jgi:hypothetical protein
MCSASGVVRQLDRHHRPDLEAQALQGEGGGRVADVAVGDMGLD